MHKTFFLVSLIFLTQNLFAQFHDWESITNMNDVKDIAIFGNEIWAVSDGGAFTYNKLTEAIQKWTNIDGLKSVNLKSVSVDKHGNIIFGSKEGFVQTYNPNSQEWTELDFEGLTVNDLLINDDTLWVSTENEKLPGKTIAAFVWKKGQYEFNDFFVNFPENVTSINKIALFNKRVWLATEKGILSAKSDFTTLNDPQNWTLYTTAHGLPNNNVLSFSVFDNKLWCGTSSGISFVDNDNSINADNTFNGKSITSLEKSNGNLLVISNKTLYQFLPGTGILNQKNYTKNLNCLSIDEDGLVWLGIEKSGLKDSENIVSVTLDGPSQNAIRYIFRDAEDRIWASNGKFKLTPGEGYSVYENGIWSGINFSGSVWGGLDNIDYIYEDRFNNIWLGSWGGTLSVFDGIKYHYFNSHSHTGTKVKQVKHGVQINKKPTGTHPKKLQKNGSYPIYAQ
jgi:two-component system sensor histidine kinase ChiS